MTKKTKKVSYELAKAVRMPKHFNDYQVTKFEELVSLVAAAMEDWEYEMSTRVVARAVLVALVEADELREFRPT